jgi:CRP-like cAMP-binding protein
MIESKEALHPLRNRILAGLPIADFERLLPELELVELRYGEVLYQSDEPIRHVYFPNLGTISLIVVMENGAQAEVGIVGGEGMLGLSVVLGAESSPHLAIAQIPDNAMKMSVKALRAEVAQGNPLYRLLLRYAEALFIQTAQIAACNRLHHLDGRLARWLLMSQDRLKSDRLQSTQEFIATMLGVRRAGVTAAATALQEAGVISYSRGTIHILNRKHLEKASCECYKVVEKELDRLFTPARIRHHPLLPNRNIRA